MSAAATTARLYRVPKGAQGSLYYETGDLAVHALAVDRSDVLYAATLRRERSTASR